MQKNEFLKKNVSDWCYWSGGKMNFFRLLLILVILDCGSYSLGTDKSGEIDKLKKENELLKSLLFLNSTSLTNNVVNSNNPDVSSGMVIMPTSIRAIRSCGLICAYQYDYSFSIKNPFSETITITSIKQEFLSSLEDSNSLCTANWENGSFTEDCAIQGIFLSSERISSPLEIKTGVTTSFRVNNAGYQSQIGYVRIIIGYKTNTENGTSSGSSSVTF